VMLPGKIFVLLRDVISDTIDFTTNLCLHAIETQKLQRKIGDTVSEPLLLAITAIRKGEPETLKMQQAVLESFPTLSERERAGLLSIWPTTLVQNINNILFQYGDYSLIVSSGVEKYDEDISEKWTQKVIQAARELLDVYSFENVDVDIISSNTHSVVNILSPYLHSKRSAIFEWAKIHKMELLEATSRLGEQDTLYVLAQSFLKAHPEQAVLRTKMEKEFGIFTIVEQDLTGITVQIINPAKLDKACVDEGITFKQYPSGPHAKRQHLLINIDFCFGHQAEDILGCLILVFGHSIKSLNVLGKAGGLVGKRGDILMPTHLVLQVHDEIRTLTNSGLDPDLIAKDSQRPVHVGPVLTIEGTLLQDRTLLTYYKLFYRCVGLEMEGSYYLRSIERGIVGGSLQSEINLRFLYYVSDIPLDQESTLSKGLSVAEGVAPLYATTRSVLREILKRDNGGSASSPTLSSSNSSLNGIAPQIKWGLRTISAMSHEPNGGRRDSIRCSIP